MTLCSVCETRPAEAGTLKCRHTFCHQCFDRYLVGSLQELDHELRCCICGNRNILTSEAHPDPVVVCFGRDCFPKLADPGGITMMRNGDFILPDRGSGRIIKFSQRGEALLDSAFVHGANNQVGVEISKEGLIVIPMQDEKYVFLAYYNSAGSFMSSCYLPEDAVVKGLAVTADNYVVCSDYGNSALLFVNPHRILVRKVDFPQLRDESYRPKPYGVVVNSLGQIIVSDSANSCLKFFDGNGKFLFREGCLGSQPGQFVDPAGIALDRKNQVLVADKGNNRVQLLDDRGKFLAFVVRYRQGDTVYLAPEDLVASGEEQVAVLLKGTQDAEAAEVRIYQYPFIPT